MFCSLGNGLYIIFVFATLYICFIVSISLLDTIFVKVVTFVMAAVYTYDLAFCSPWSLIVYPRF